MGKYLVLMPSFNEEGNIERIILNIKALLKDIPVVVINDGSSDKTSFIAKRSGATVLDFPFNLGYGVALQAGYKFALEGGYDFVVQIDADGQHNVEDIKRLTQEIKNDSADIVIGSRFLGSTVYKMDLIRRIGVLLFGWIVTVCIKQKITDCTSGFQAINRRALEFYCQDIFPSDFPDADIIILSHFAGLRIKEVPVVMHKSPPEKQQMHSGLTKLYYIFKMFLSITVTLLSEKPKRISNGGGLNVS